MAGLSGQTSHAKSCNQEQYNMSSKPSEERRSRVFVFSHKTKAGVKRLIEQIRLYVSNDHCDAPVGHLCDLAHTFCSHRSALTWRTAFTASTWQELKNALEEPGIEPRRALLQPRLGLIFTGQGAQWYGMGRNLIHSYSVFRHSLETAEGCVKKLGANWSLMGSNLLREAWGYS